MGLLRILLAFCVFLGHSGDALPFPILRGLSAVEAFFIISGFYMQLVIASRYNAERLGRSWPLRFYASRYLRLLPSYLIMVVVSVGSSLIGLTSQPVETWGQISKAGTAVSMLALKAFLVFTNATLLFQDAVMFLSVRAGQAHASTSFSNSDVLLWKALAVPQAWSLGLELSFYLLAPLLLNLRSRWLVTLIAASLCLKVLTLSALHLGDPFTYRFFPSEIGYFLAGAIAYRSRSKLEFRAVPAGVRAVAACAFLALFVSNQIEELAGPFGNAALLVLALPMLFELTRNLKIDRFIGEFSYPLYLTHFWAIAVTRSPGHIGEALLLTLLASAVLLAIEQVWVEPWRERLALSPSADFARSGNIPALFATPAQSKAREI